MKRIKSIDILNFKVFRHREYFELNGKNLLVYGTNGSGKSSLFWALYTFLQSSGKPQKEVEKYFDPEDERNLRNIFSNPTDPSFIKVTFIDEDQQEHMNRIGVSIANNPTYDNTIAVDPIADFFAPGSINTRDKYIKTYLFNTLNNPDVQIADSASEFINYRLLLNFYNASHSDKSDLIFIFETNIFPFFKNTDGDSFSPIFYDLIDNPPRVQREKRLAEERASNASFERLSDATIRTINEEYEIKRAKFNDDLNTLFNELNEVGNQFLKTHFTNREDKYKFEITFYSEEEEIYNLYVDEQGYAKKPYIILNVWQKDSQGDHKNIWRPHSFLNEAKLTQLALSIRLAAFKLKLQKSPSIIQTLVLDDLLISLDMSNRMIVLEIILQEFIDYQLIILTHDKGFFDLVNLKTKATHNDWIKLEFYDTEDEGNPIVRINEDYLARADGYEKNNEFDLAAVMLRKKAENILKIYLDPELKQLTIFNTKDTLNDFLSKAKKHPFNDPYNKFIEFIGRNRLSIDDLDNYNINNSSVKNTVTGTKITEMIGFLSELLEQSKTQMQWLIDTDNIRTELSKIIVDMENISSRVLNSGAHATTAAMYKQEIKEAIKIIKNANVKLGL